VAAWSYGPAVAEPAGDVAPRQGAPTVLEVRELPAASLVARLARPAGPTDVLAAAPGPTETPPAQADSGPADLQGDLTDVLAASMLVMPLSR
jgi:hypothetical protein